MVLESRTSMVIKTQIDFLGQLDGLKSKMSTKTIQKNISSLVEAINTLFSGLIEELSATASKGKIKIDDIKTAMDDSRFQNNLTSVVTDNLPKASRSREKKLKDPEAPKRPKPAYLFFCDEKRQQIKTDNPEMKMTEISVKLGEMWNALSDKKKEKFNKMAGEAKEEYQTAMASYERPSDEDLAKLSVNNRRRKSGKEGKSKRNKDPNEPKRPCTAFIFFSKDKREEVKESNPEMKGTEIMVELGRMWKEDFADEKSRKKWVSKAEKDKIRFKEEMESYTPPAKSEDESAPKRSADVPAR